MTKSEKNLEKQKEIKEKINHLLYSNEELDVKQSEWICDVFKRKCLLESEFTHSEIKLVKDTDWHTNYDIFFYKYENLIMQSALYHISTMNRKDEIDIYLNKKYPLIKDKKIIFQEKKEVVSDPQLTYLLTDGRLFKIGKSLHPEKRIKQLQTANPHIEMICYGSGVSEKYLHELLFKDRVKLEWFNLTEEKIENIKKLLEKGEQGRKKGNKKEGIRYKLSDSEKKRNADGRKKSEELSCKYVIPFGKYKGIKICDMVSDEQYDYCVWLYGEMSKNLSGNQKNKSRKYKAFSWALKNNQKNLIN